MDTILGLILLTTAVALLVAWVRSDTFTAAGFDGTSQKGARLTADALLDKRYW